jgi:hypothetical protein
MIVVAAVPHFRRPHSKVPHSIAFAAQQRHPSPYLADFDKQSLARTN